MLDVVRKLHVHVDGAVEDGAVLDDHARRLDVAGHLGRRVDGHPRAGVDVPEASPLMVSSSARMSACTLPVLSMVRWLLSAICPSTRPSMTRSPPPVRFPLMTIP